MADAARQSLVPVHASSLTRFGRELLAMVVLFSIYKFGRVVHTSDVDLAYTNAQRIWDFERWSHLPNELDAQQAMLPMQGLVEFANTYYAFVHIPATAVFLIWMYLRRPELYPPVRRAIIAMTAVALLGHILFPLAPPRMLTQYGFVDTAAVYGPANVYGADPDAQSLINQYAAMPSLHVGWAMLVAAGMIAAFKTQWRWLWLLHPTITSMAVVGTANHYWIDGIIACVVLALVVYLFGNASPLPWERLNPTRLVRRGRPDPAPDYYGIVPDTLPEGALRENIAESTTVESITAEHDAQGVAPVERTEQDLVTGARVAPGPPSS
ncbi:MAG TPA: phosphatase PAP2 family protein [Nonomuraea sp.]|nr:phosphatase PAP2 family protein [Nonomuraea sp.]